MKDSTETGSCDGPMLISPQFRVIRGKGTERPGSHEYDHSFNEGTYSTSTRQESAIGGYFCLPLLFDTSLTSRLRRL